MNQWRNVGRLFGGYLHPPQGFGRFNELFGQDIPKGHCGDRNVMPDSLRASGTIRGT